MQKYGIFYVKVWSFQHHVVKSIDKLVWWAYNRGILVLSLSKHDYSRYLTKYGVGGKRGQDIPCFA